MFKNKFWVLGVILIFGVGLMTLWPSFDLALTGDDYLGLWRYNYSLNRTDDVSPSAFQYFFTDYGPMDTITATIYNYFGFRDRVYYIVSFTLRMLAAISFVWPVYKLTRNKWAAIGSAVFFAVTTTGLEATDWSFNMPSYLAIALTNALLGCFVIRAWIFIPILFVLTIVVQPIRTMFLPILMVGLEGYAMITNFSFKNIFFGLTRICVYVFLLTNILKYTSYGQAVSLRGKSVLLSNFEQVTKLAKDKNYKVLVSPIAQLGQIVIPNSFMFQRTEVWGLQRTFRRVVLPAFVIFLFCLVIFRTSRLISTCAIVAASSWTIFVWKLFMNPTGYLLQPFELLAYLFGGYLLIVMTTWWIKTESSLKFGLFLSLLLMVSGFILFWIRTPGTIHEITGRYLIVSGAGLSWFVGMLLATASKTKNRMLFLTFGVLLAVHAQSSHRYLFHLSEVRGIELTARLRNSIQAPPDFKDPSEPVVYFFEGDNPEILHHAFLFGWPVISTFKFDLVGPWYRIAPTDKWEEVVSAYQDGEALKRFMPGNRRAKLENIFAYRLENRNLIDVTEEKREELKKLKLK